eukprot:GHVP01030974.1.p1 GENE.GHVP01030974.1~~GHVP01030974.1.p1  ORF type:complete len:718 (+),score=113.77 GHVP01030974.1:47-2155(+)
MNMNKSSPIESIVPSNRKPSSNNISIKTEKYHVQETSLGHLDISKNVNSLRTIYSWDSNLTALVNGSNLLLGSQKTKKAGTVSFNSPIIDIAVPDDNSYRIAVLTTTNLNIVSILETQEELSANIDHRKRIFNEMLGIEWLPGKPGILIAHGVDIIERYNFSNRNISSKADVSNTITTSPIDCISVFPKGDFLLVALEHTILSADITGPSLNEEDCIPIKDLNQSVIFMISTLGRVLIVTEDSPSILSVYSQDDLENELYKITLPEGQKLSTSDRLVYDKNLDILLILQNGNFLSILKGIDLTNLPTGHVSICSFLIKANLIGISIPHCISKNNLLIWGLSNTGLVSIKINLSGQKEHRYKTENSIASYDEDLFSFKGFNNMPSSIDSNETSSKELEDVSSSPETFEDLVKLESHKNKEAPLKSIIDIHDPYGPFCYKKRDETIIPKESSCLRSPSKELITPEIANIMKPEAKKEKKPDDIKTKETSSSLLKKLIEDTIRTEVSKIMNSLEEKMKTQYSELGTRITTEINQRFDETKDKIDTLVKSFDLLIAKKESTTPVQTEKIPSETLIQKSERDFNNQKYSDGINRIAKKGKDDDIFWLCQSLSSEILSENATGNVSSFLIGRITSLLKRNDKLIDGLFPVMSDLIFSLYEKTEEYNITPLKFAEDYMTSFDTALIKDKSILKEFKKTLILLSRIIRKI